MTRTASRFRTLAGLLLASAALPLTPGLAQTAPATDPPAPTITPPATAPVAQPAPAPNPPVTITPPAVAQPAPTASQPVVNTRASGLEPTDPPAEADADAAPAPRERPARARTVSRAAAPVRVVRSPAPAPAAADPTSTPVAAESAAAPPVAAPLPAPVAEAPPADPPAETVPAEAPAEQQAAGTGLWPWLLAAALAVGALLLFARRRRRTAKDHVDEEPILADDHADAGPDPIFAAPAAAAASHVAASEAGRPWLDLAITPVRAGVGQDAARVEFALGIENNGAAPARDVRISTWLLPAGSATEMETMLIERPASAERREAELAPGETSRIDTAVDLPRDGLFDAILPVVVADARYTLPDGSEGRTAASFAVGVPRGEELVMFDVDNPSGLHEGVEARLHGQPTRD